MQSLLWGTICQNEYKASHTGDGKTLPWTQVLCICHCSLPLPGKMCTLSAWSNTPACRRHKPKPALGLRWGLPAAKENVWAGWIAQAFPFNIPLQAAESTLIHAQHQPISRPLNRSTLVHDVPKHRAVWGCAQALGGLKLGSALAQTPTKAQSQGQALQQPGKAQTQRRARQQCHLCSSCGSLWQAWQPLHLHLYLFLAWGLLVQSPDNCSWENWGCSGSKRESFGVT